MCVLVVASIRETGTTAIDTGWGREEKGKYNSISITNPFHLFSASASLWSLLRPWRSWALSLPTCRFLLWFVWVTFLYKIQKRNDFLFRNMRINLHEIRSERRRGPSCFFLIPFSRGGINRISPNMRRHRSTASYCYKIRRKNNFVCGKAYKLRWSFVAWFSFCPKHILPIIMIEMPTRHETWLVSTRI